LSVKEYRELKKIISSPVMAKVGDWDRKKTKEKRLAETTRNEEM